MICENKPPFNYPYRFAVAGTCSKAVMARKSEYIMTTLILKCWLLHVMLLAGCSERIPEQKQPAVPRTELDMAIIADTVTYDVIVRNPSPEDLWTQECLKNLRTGALIDFIFNAIYRNELVPYDYFTSRALSVSEIVELENSSGFSRDKIGRIRFSEEWYFCEENLRMKKRVNSMALGYEVFDSEGNLRGYKPAFMVKLN